MRIQMSHHHSLINCSLHTEENPVEQEKDIVNTSPSKRYFLLSCVNVFKFNSNGLVKRVQIGGIELNHLTHLSTVQTGGV